MLARAAASTSSRSTSASGVREVWIWRRGRIGVHVLGHAGYAEVPSSRPLPGVDLDELLGYLDRPSTYHAVRDHRTTLAARRGPG